MAEEVMMGLKMNFSNHWLMVRLNLNLDNVRNCEETATFVKEFEKVLSVRKQGLLFEKFKEPDQYKEMCKEKWWK